VAREYNPENHSPDPAEFSRLIETSRRLAEVGNFEKATDAANNAVFYASDLNEVDQANGEARLHSKKWAEQRNARGESRREKTAVQAKESQSSNKPKRKKDDDDSLTMPEGRQELMNVWGVSYALIKQDPELYQWFEGKTREYIKNPEGFSKDAFFLELNQQPFAQKYSAAAIADMDFETRFPDVWAQQIDAEVEGLRDQAIQFGAQMTDQELRDLAVRKRRMGLSDAQVGNILTEYTTAVDGVYSGTAGQIQTGLREWSRRNGIDISENMIDQYVRQIQAGDTTEDDVLMDLRRTYLAGAYPAWSDRIEAGQDIYDIAQPYRRRVANLLEVDESQVTLNDQLLQRGLQNVGSDGKPRVMPLYEFEQEIRKDPRWEFTDNAYDVYSRVGENLLRTFGFR